MEIKRDYYVKKLTSSIGNGFVKVITGTRRVGKSYILFNLFYNHLINNGIKQDTILRLSLDKYENYKFHDLDVLYNHISKFINDCKYDKKFILIDEIQLVKPKRDKVINQKIDFSSLLINFMDRADIYVTGSNSKMLSRDIITEFRGRSQEIKIYPLTFKEVVKHDSKKTDINIIWKQYYTYGSLPRTILFSNDELKVEYLNELFNLTYIKDIIERYKIRKDEFILNKLVKIIALNISNLLNPLNISNTFKSENKIDISSYTISSYISYLIDSFILYELNRQDLKTNKILSSPSKFYFSDVGIRNSLINFNDIKLNRLLENIVHNELLFRKYNVYVGNIETFHKDNQNKTQRQNFEIDFIVNKVSKKFYIQVVDTIKSQEKLDQEIRPLKLIKDNFKKIVVVNDVFDHYVDEFGIEYYSIFDFLLKDDWEK